MLNKLFFIQVASCCPEIRLIMWYQMQEWWETFWSFWSSESFVGLCLHRQRARLYKTHVGAGTPVNTLLFMTYHYINNIVTLKRTSHMHGAFLLFRQWKSCCWYFVSVIRCIGTITGCVVSWRTLGMTVSCLPMNFSNFLTVPGKKEKHKRNGKHGKTCLCCKLVWSSE